MNLVWGNDSSGDQSPLFGINCTHGIEGENYAYLHNNIRHEIVLNGAIAFMSRCTLVRTKLMEKFKNYLSTNATGTQKALEYINKEGQAMNNHIVSQIDPSQDIYNVVKAGRTHIVDVNEKTCIRCLIQQQFELPCRHVMQVLVHKNERKIMQYVHYGYQIKNLYQLLLKQTVIIPDYKDSLPYTTLRVKPPAKYNYVKGVGVAIDNSTPKAGCPSKRRFALIGEFRKGEKRLTIQNSILMKMLI
jgi:hypothetical protein